MKCFALSYAAIPKEFAITARTRQGFSPKRNPLIPCNLYIYFPQSKNPPSKINLCFLYFPISETCNFVFIMSWGYDQIQQLTPATAPTINPW